MNLRSRRVTGNSPVPAVWFSLVSGCFFLGHDIFTTNKITSEKHCHTPADHFNRRCARGPPHYHLCVCSVVWERVRVLESYLARTIYSARTASCMHTTPWYFLLQ